MAVHLRGAFLMSRAVQKHMTEPTGAGSSTCPAPPRWATGGRPTTPRPRPACRASPRRSPSSWAVRRHRERGRAGVHRDRHDRGDRRADGVDFETFERARRPDSGPPGRPARRRRQHRVLPRQRGSGVRLRAGHLRRRRLAVTEHEVDDLSRERRRGGGPVLHGRAPDRRSRTGWSSCAPGSTPGWPGCTSRRARRPRRAAGAAGASWTRRSRRPGARRTTTRAHRHRPRHGRADDPRVRHRRAEAALPAAAVDRRGGLVPALQRAGRRLRPGRPRHPGRPRRRRLGRQRPEGVDLQGPQGAAGRS